MRKNTLVLTRQNIERLIAMPEALRIVENTFKAQGQGKAQMPEKIYLRLNKYNGDFRAMPAYIGGIDGCGIKWVNVYPGNKKFGLPAVTALIILNDPKTGFPLAVMDGTYITNLRTGAAGGIAAKYLARKNSKKVAIIGCGVQAQTQLMALNEIFGIESASAYDCVQEYAIAFIKKMRLSGFSVKKCTCVAECVKNADIIVTTTPSRRPLVKSKWVGEGTHINAIGADAKGKEELDPVILRRSKVVVDDVIQAAHSGEINVPVSKGLFSANDVCASLAEIVTGKKKGRTAKGDITVFDSTGLAILDVAVAAYVYKRALRVIGQKALFTVNFS